jgi:hypothetical protein
MIVLISPSQPQSTELFKKIHGFWSKLAGVPKADQETLTKMQLANGSRIVSLPGSEKTTRGYSAAKLVVMDEASRVPDELLAVVRPMLATTRGRFLALSTPAGKRGWFYSAWQDGEGWERIKVKAADCPRISAEFLKEEMSALGPMQFSQEYECQFIDNETSVFNSELIEAALTDDFAPFLARAAWVWGGRSMIYSRPRACRPMAFRLRLEPRSQGKMHYSVPKLTLISTVQALLHDGRLKIQKDFPDVQTLVAELQDFRAGVTDSGYWRFGARAGKHDDLVLALAIALWHSVGRDRTTGIIDFYQWRVEGDRAAANVIPPDDAAAVRLRAPAGVSEVWGKSGRRYYVGENGVVSMPEPDALPLKIAGWKELEHV